MSDIESLQEAVPLEERPLYENPFSAFELEDSEQSKSEKDVKNSESSKLQQDIEGGHKIESFCSIMLPPIMDLLLYPWNGELKTGNSLPKASERPDLQLLKQAFEKESLRSLYQDLLDKEPVEERKAEFRMDVVEYQQAFDKIIEQWKKKLDELLNDEGFVFQRIKEWVNVVTKTLKNRVYTKDLGGEDSQLDKGKFYHNRILYIVTIPEFGLNGRMKKDGNGKKAVFDARYPLPVQMERKIAEVLHKALQSEFKHLRLMFAFSSASYSLDVEDYGPTKEQRELFEKDASLLMLPRAPGKQKRKLPATNRITVLTSTPAAPWYVTKFESSGIDGWNSRSKKDLSFFSHNVLLHQRDESSGALVVSRYKEILKDLDCFGEEELLIGFGTCRDVMINDRYSIVKGGKLLNAKLVILLSAGVPLQLIKDASQNFILNDVYSHTVEAEDNLWSPGYYEFRNEEGGRGNFWDRRLKYFPGTEDKILPTSKRLYYPEEHRAQIGGGAFQYFYTKPIKL